ncbi:hypothetical protein D9M70_226200 [compost metagenome]
MRVPIPQINEHSPRALIQLIKPFALPCVVRMKPIALVHRSRPRTNHREHDRLLPLHGIAHQHSTRFLRIGATGFRNQLVERLLLNP